MVQLPHSDGTIELGGVQVMHFPAQSAFLTDVPSIYHPHDLQHRHYPANFSRRDWRIRDAAYRGFCGDAAAIAVANEAVRQDVMQAYGISGEKVHIVPHGSVLDAYPPLDDAAREAVRVDYGLPDRFAFYPAYSWPHKNHLALLEALALLRDAHDLRIPLVLTGGQSEYYRRIHAAIRMHHLEDQVVTLGFVPPAILKALYAMCSVLIFPSLFEGAGLPVIEALACGVPIVCSDLPSLRAIAGEAACFFDPHQTASIADGLRRVWSEEDSQVKLSQLAQRRTGEFSWARALDRYIALYQAVSVRP